MLSRWIIRDYVVDEWSSGKRSHHIPVYERFSKDTTVARIEKGDYRVVILYCTRAANA
jgi:hypothetical protein